MNFLKAEVLVSLPDNIKEDSKGKNYVGEHPELRKGLDQRCRNIKVTRSETNNYFSLNFQQQREPAGAV